MKKILCVLLLTCVIMGAAFAADTANGNYSGAKNFVSGEAGLITGGARYERMLTPQISVGGVFYWGTFFLIINNLEFGGFGRYYLYKGLFAELGLGFHIYTEGLYMNSGVAISPGIGWKLDPGEPGHFFVAPGLTVPITIGKSNVIGFDTGASVDVGFNFYCSLGYAW